MSIDPSSPFTVTPSDYPIGTVIQKFDHTLTSDDYALVFDPEDDYAIYDIAQNKETAKALVNEGYLVMVLDHIEDRGAEQYVINCEARAYADCFSRVAQVVEYVEGWD